MQTNSERSQTVGVTRLLHWRVLPRHLDNKYYSSRLLFLTSLKKSNYFMHFLNELIAERVTRMKAYDRDINTGLFSARVDAKLSD